MTAPDEVDFVSGATRLHGIVGHPIEQVRSPEMFTAEFHRRGRNALMVPLHVAPDQFDTLVPALMRLRNLDGLVFTTPFKARACALADELGPQATVVGAINALARGADGGWRGEMFDGAGCVEAFRRRGLSFAGRRVTLIGAGGAGAAIGVAVAFENPASMRLFDLDPRRAADLAERIRGLDRNIRIDVAEPSGDGCDVLLNATPVGMLDDARLPLQAKALPPRLVVMDAVMKPERTPLLALAERSGDTVVFGREMLRGQVGRVADYFGSAALET